MKSPGAYDIRKEGDFLDITANGPEKHKVSENYAQVKVCVRPQIAEAFKAKCAAEGVSMASRISGFMAETGGIGTIKKPAANSVFTRGQRRKAVKGMIELLEKVLIMETRYMESIPPNLQNSVNYETADETVAALEEALGLLREAY